MEEVILVLVVAFRVLASQVVQEVFEAVDGRSLKVRRRDTALSPVHQEAHQLDPIALGELQAILGSPVVLEEAG